jgi:hypothetical protein
MNKEFVGYAEALELKELGFDEPSYNVYDINDKELVEFGEYVNKDLTNDAILAPLYQQAFRFFREKHGFFCSPTESDDDITKKYDWHIIKNLGDGKFHIRFIGYKDTYEEAELACLKKLIEIVKNKENVDKNS